MDSPFKMEIVNLFPLNLYKTTLCFSKRYIMKDQQIVRHFAGVKQNSFMILRWIWGDIFKTASRFEKEGWKKYSGENNHSFIRESYWTEKNNTSE